MINLKYIMSGKATFTFTNPKNEHYTFKITYSKAIKQHFAYLLTGPDNTRDYTYIGMMVDGKIRLTNKSKYKIDSKQFMVINYAIAIASRQKMLRNGYKLEHNGHCGHCGRELTTPESIACGLGPVCRSK